MELRKSLQDIAHMLRDIPYPGAIPEDIKHLHCYVIDGGHCILAIPHPLLHEALQKHWRMYEVPLPVKYVLAKGYMHIPGTDAITVDVEYDKDCGCLVPDGYEEF